MARPTKYTKDLGNRICAELADGRALTRICKDPKMPSTVTIYAWLQDPNKAEFLNNYVRAREDQAHTLANEILDISDDGSADKTTTSDGVKVTNHEAIARSRLRVDARKWLSSKLLPKIYGDKLHNEHSGEIITVRVSKEDE